jgi:hypothetical protein
MIRNWRLWLVVGVVLLVGILLYGASQREEGKKVEKIAQVQERADTIVADVRDLKKTTKHVIEEFKKADSVFAADSSVKSAAVAVDIAKVVIAVQDTTIAKLDTLVRTKDALLKLKYPTSARLVPYVAGDYDPLSRYSAVRAGIDVRLGSHLRVGVAVQIASDSSFRRLVTGRYEFR